MIMKGVDMPLEVGGVALSPELQQKGWFLTDREMENVRNVLDYFVDAYDVGDLLTEDAETERYYSFSKDFLERVRRVMSIPQEACIK